MDVVIIGLGYVGLTLAVYLAKKGYHVYGIDNSEQVLQSLREGRAHFFEEGFDQQLQTALAAGSFSFDKEIPRYSTPITYIVTVGTPIGADKHVNLEPIKAVSHLVKGVLKEGDLVILRSTLRIGVTRGLVKPILDEGGAGYYLAFCPERTLEGKAFEELASLPQIVAGIDQKSLVKASEFFKPVASEMVLLEEVEEAEMAKLLNNCERDLMFSFANEIALMCDAKGLNASRVIAAANYRYPRSNLRKPGPVGGPCLGKDPYILAEAFEGSDYEPRLLKAGRSVNEDMIPISLARACEILDKKLAGKASALFKIAILGFAFKGVPPTSDLRGSMVVPLIHFLRDRYPGATLVGHDWLADHCEMTATGVQVAQSVEEAVDGAQLVILQNNHPAYAALDWTALCLRISLAGVIYDFWAQIEPVSMRGDITYLCLGNLTRRN